MLNPVRVSAPAVLPLTLDEAKSQLNIDHSDDDELVEAAIEAAAARLDGFTGILGRALVSQTWRQDFDGFGSCMRLRVRELIAVVSVAYYDSSNVQQTLASTVYTAFSDERGPYLALKSDQAWPSSYGRPDAVSVTWTAGYGTAASDVPAPIRWAMRMMIGDFHAHRENTITGTIVAELPSGVMSLLGPYIVKGFG